MRMKLDNRFHKLEVAMRQVQADIKNIKKMVGKETQDRLEALEEFATYADEMLTALNHALPDPEYDAKCEAEVADVEASLDRHRERLGLNKPKVSERDIAKEPAEVDLSSELTGSELCKAMLARGDTRIMCEVYDDGNRNDLTHVIRAYSDDKFHTKANRWSHAVPINNQGEPLTAAEVGL